MILIDDNNQVRDWLEKNNINDIGITRLDLVTFELANGLGPELVMVQDTILNQMDKITLDKLSQIKAVIIFKTSKAAMSVELDNIISIVDPNIELNILKNQLNFLEDIIRQDIIVKSQLLSLSAELQDLMGGVETQLLRVKKAYEKHAPKRLEDFKGITVYSKYAAGEDMGGEFFDTYSDGQKVFILMSASSSYLASSSILEHFSTLKVDNEINKDVEVKFIEDVKNDVMELNKNKKKPIELKLMTCIIDFNTMKMVGHMFGDFQLLTSKLKEKIVKNCHIDGDIEAARFDFELERGERILFNSPGFVANWSNSNPKFLIEELVRNNKVKGLDILDEIYFQLRKQSEKNFLAHDASSIILEVHENVMVQI